MKDFAQHGWKEVSLGEICEKTETVDPRKAPEDEFDYVDVSSVSNETFTIGETQKLLGSDAPSRARRLIRSGDIIFATIRPTLQRIAQVPEHLDRQVCSTGYIVFRPKPSLDARFLMHALFRPDFMNAMETLQSGASYPAVTDKQARDQKIPLPPLEEQQRIVAVLDEAFEGLARARAHAEANLQNARELFDRAAFEIFEDLRTEHPTHSLEELSQKITKGSSPKWQGISYVEEPGVLFVTSENVGKNEIDLSKTKYVEEAFNEKDRKSILARGDVLTNIVGASIGRTAVFELDDVANINQAVCLIRCDSQRLNNDFLSYLLNSPYFKAQLHAGEVNMARANLSLTFFRELKVPVPPLDTQDEAVQKIDALRLKTETLEKDYQSKLQDLDDLRQSLLQKAFAGELT